MSEVISSLSVAPLYGLVVVESEGATDLPVVETGRERFVATAESLLIATRGDNDGDVLVEVRRGAEESNLGEQIFDGELSFTSPRLVFGSSLGCELGVVDVGRTGWLPVRVFVSPADLPSRVVVMLGDAETAACHAS